MEGVLLINLGGRVAAGRKVLGWRLVVVTFEAWLYLKELSEDSLNVILCFYNSWTPINQLRPIILTSSALRHWRTVFTVWLMSWISTLSMISPLRWWQNSNKFKKKSWAVVSLIVLTKKLLFWNTDSQKVAKRVQRGLMDPSPNFLSPGSVGGNSRQKSFTCFFFFCHMWFSSGLIG